MTLDVIDARALHAQVPVLDLHRLLDAGKVRSLRLGRRRLIPASEVERLASEGC